MKNRKIRNKVGTVREAAAASCSIGIDRKLAQCQARHPTRRDKLGNILAKKRAVRVRKELQIDEKR